MRIFLLMLLAYVIGSIPFGVVVSRLFKIDITRVGSGNIGATNVLRTLGLIPGAIVLSLDLLKGTAATLIAIFAVKDPLWVVICGLSAVLGHMFPVFLRFKGGKGAAIGLGVLLAIAPDIFAVAVLFVVVVIAFTRYVSLASVTGPILVAGLMYLTNKPAPYLVADLIVTTLMIIKHIPNLKRLMAGTERRVGDNNDG